MSGAHGLRHPATSVTIVVYPRRMPNWLAQVFIGLLFLATSDSYPLGETSQWAAFWGGIALVLSGVVAGILTLVRTRRAETPAAP